MDLNFGPEVRDGAEEQRPRRLDGTSRIRGRQRRHRVVHALLQKNVLNTRRWETKEELRLAIVIWIEKKYHRQRRKRRLGRLTPVEFEALHRGTKAA
ncbi:MAG: integrase [Acidimicrobiaceae bacterium]|nr:integrase [Acidimicrobiaceae bacterium]